MVEDQLTPNQRIRLESLALAVGRYTMKPIADKEILNTAERFLSWLREEDNTLPLDKA